jgi:hypothetical protein
MTHIHSDTDIRVIDGRRFHRSAAAPFYQAEDEQLPAIICECGSETFRLSYGAWESTAHCTKCGKQEVVYSG